MQEIIKFRECPELINNSAELFKKIRDIKIDYGQENMIVFFLDSRNKLIDYELMFKGGLNTAVVDPKTIFRRALEHNANSMILAHNHPSGSLKPSKEDVDTYKALKHAGNLIAIEVVDSVIFDKDNFYSMDCSEWG